MKTKLLALATLLSLVASGLRAAPLAETAAVYSKPDTTSAPISYLKAGTEPVLAPASAGAAPTGWTAVQLAGPHELYVQNKEITKSLDVRPGAQLRNAPKPDAPVIATAGKDDALDITGLHGRWTQVRLNKAITGYIKTPAAPAAAPAPLPVASAPASASVRPAPAPGTPTPAPFAPAPSSPGAFANAPAGQAAPMINLGDGGTSALPRMFQGKFVSTRSAFKPRRPYDWALTDEGGARFAYLDISRLLQTEQIEKYIDHTIAVFGAAKPIPGTKDFVIMVESLQLR